MIKVVIAYDNNDSELGNYFEESFDNISVSISSIPHISLAAIQGLDCTAEIIEQEIRENSSPPFIFVCLSHGDDDGVCLLTDNDVFVHSDNVSHYVDSFFYTTACCVAKVLGKTLISNSCKCFIGCSESSLVTYEEFNDIYCACENYSIREFLKSDKTIQDTFDEMILFFDSMIDKYTDQNEILFAMELENNKECMVILGDGSLTKSYFNVHP